MPTGSSSISVLHLEDSDLDAIYVRERLKNVGLSVDVKRATDRQSFVKLLHERTYDIILSDYQVPTFDGPEALDLAREYQPETPFIFVSGAMGEDLAVETLKRGATDYVLKDRLGRLGPSIQRALFESQQRRERVKAEKSLRAIEERLRLALHSARMGTWDLDLQTGRFECSNFCKASYGRAPEEAFGFDDLVKSICDEDRNGWDKSWNEAISLGADFEIEFRVYWPDGELHWAHIRGGCTKDSHGNTIAVSGVSLDVTERRRSVEALRASEERYRTLFTSIEQGFCAVDVMFDSTGRAVDYRFLEANPVFEVQTGLVDVVGKTVKELVPNLEPHWFEIYGRVAKTGESARFNNGSAAMGRWFDVSASRVGNDGSHKVAILFSDVTERKRAEYEREKLLKEVETERERLADVFQLAPSLMCVLRGPDHVLERANDRFCLLVGRSEILGKTIREALPELEAQGFVELLDKVYRFGEPFVGTGVPVLLQREPGCPLEEHFIDFVYQPLRDSEGRVSGVLAQGVDLTDRKRAEDKLTTLLIEEQRYATLLERVASASRSINAVLSAESIARIVTEEACAIIGARVGITTFTTTEDCSQHVRAVRRLDGQDSLDEDASEPEFDADLAGRVCKENQPIRVPRDSRSKAGWGRIAVPLVGHGNRNLGSVQLIDRWEGDFTAEDESVLVQLVAIAAVGIENARLYERLRNQDRRKDEFLATLAHELRNPLAPIRTGLSVLNMTTKPEETVKIREVMERQVAHMVRLIDDLLDVSRITRGKVKLKRERVDLRDVINEALEVSAPLIEGSRHQLIFTPMDAPVWLDADRTRLAQVVSNLLNNAAKYTPANGTIQLHAAKEGGEAVISVTDNGIGIEGEMLTRVFEMFTQVGQTVDRAQGGLGIGLALVSSLVEMHGGRVSATSDGLGKGSTFTVRLPIGMSLEARAAESDATLTKTPVSVLRVMVVDDNVDGAQTLALLLQMAGHATAVAFTGPEALENARQFKPDVIFLDIGLPGMSGYEVAQRLRDSDAHGNMIIVALTGWGTDDDRRQAREAGFDFHMTKPVDASRLEGMLADLAASRR
jgi:PAS domain S-box-containing protein